MFRLSRALCQRNKKDIKLLTNSLSSYSIDSFSHQTMCTFNPDRQINGGGQVEAPHTFSEAMAPKIRSYPSKFSVLHYVHTCRMHGSSKTADRVIPEAGFLPLNSLRDRPGSRKEKTRLGRGIGSGKGKTAGRGHKGQKARAGRKPRIGFEGGQTPLRLTLPKRGFHNPFKLKFQVVNLSKIAEKIKSGHIDPAKLITMKTLKEARAVGKAVRDGVKLLGRGSKDLSVPINIEVSRVSADAKQAIEAVGGSVVQVHYNKLGLRALLNPEWFEKKGRLLPRAARPPPRIQENVDAIGRLPAPSIPLRKDQFPVYTPRLV